MEKPWQQGSAGAFLFGRFGENGEVMERTAHLPAEIDWHNWGKLFTVTSLWQPVVTRICRQTGVSPANTIDAAYPGSCAVFVADRAVVVKIFPPIFAADFERETAVYDAIQDRLPHIPRLLAKGIYRDQIDWPYFILEFRPGEPIREVRPLLSAADKKHIGGELGHMIRQLHNSPLPEGMSASWSKWSRFLVANRERTLGHFSEKRPFAAPVITEIEAFLSQTESIWLKKSPLHLINADLTQDHLLLLGDGDGWRVSAVIDWADAEAGVPAYEWIPLWYGLCARDIYLFQAILSTYNPSCQFDNTFWQEILAFTFLHRFGSEIVADVLDQHGHPNIISFGELQSYLCPTPLIS
jgi:hygromycin-B 7''-O-kinase